jgi:CheY-like chemotaxis protein
MSVEGPIVIVDDDEDDQVLIQKVIEELQIPNPCEIFDTCDAAFAFLLETETKPLVIFSDINLPKKSGLDFKKEIDSNPYLRQKSIPFVFLSTSADVSLVTKAYLEMTIQGFFQKPSSFSDLKALIALVINYWRTCRHPSIY